MRPRAASPSHNMTRQCLPTFSRLNGSGSDAPAGANSCALSERSPMRLRGRNEGRFLVGSITGSEGGVGASRDCGSRTGSTPPLCDVASLGSGSGVGSGGGFCEVASLGGTTTLGSGGLAPLFSREMESFSS